MAKKSAIQNNEKKKSLVTKLAAKREKLKALCKNKDLPIDARFNAQIALSELPRNSSKVRVRNRCQITGRPRAFYGRFKISRIVLRDLVSLGLVPGVIKASW